MARWTAADVRKLTGQAVPKGTATPRANPYTTSVCVLCDRAGLPRPLAEYVFAPGRKWRADFCWVDERVALEVDGGTWSGGRHTRGSGWLKDAEKRRAYAALGYLVIPCQPKELHAGVWVETVREALRWRQGGTR